MSSAPFKGKITFGEIKNKLLEAAKLGLSQASCARYAGIDPETLKKYLDEKGEWYREFGKARAEGAISATSSLAAESQAGGMSGVKASEILLSALDPENFGGKTQQGNVNINVMIPIFEGQYEKDIIPFIEVEHGQAEEDKGRRIGNSSTPRNIPGSPEAPGRPATA